jgi:hypothetical protein
MKDHGEKAGRICFWGYSSHILQHKRFGNPQALICRYRKTSISGTTFSGKKWFHAI